MLPHFGLPSRSGLAGNQGDRNQRQRDSAAKQNDDPNAARQLSAGSGGQQCRRRRRARNKPAADANERKHRVTVVSFRSVFGAAVFMMGVTAFSPGPAKQQAAQQQCQSGAYALQPLMRPFIRYRRQRELRRQSRQDDRDRVRKRRAATQHQRAGQRAPPAVVSARDISRDDGFAMSGFHRVQKRPATKLFRRSRIAPSSTSNLTCVALTRFWRAGNTGGSNTNSARAPPPGRRRPRRCRKFPTAILPPVRTAPTASSRHLPRKQPMVAIARGAARNLEAGCTTQSAAPRRPATIPCFHPPAGPAPTAATNQPTAAWTNNAKHTITTRLFRLDPGASPWIWEKFEVRTRSVNILSVMI